MLRMEIVHARSEFLVAHTFAEGQLLFLEAPATGNAVGQRLSQLFVQVQQLVIGWSFQQHYVHLTFERHIGRY